MAVTVAQHKAQKSLKTFRHYFGNSSVGVLSMNFVDNNTCCSVKRLDSRFIHFSLAMDPGITPEHTPQEQDSPPHF